MYIEDEKGQRVLVDQFYPGELGRGLKETDRDAESMMKLLVEARDRLVGLEGTHQGKVEAKGLKASELMSDYDVFVEILKYSPEEAKELVSRIKLQKLEELKLKVMAENPTCCFGVPVPGKEE